MKQMRDRTGSLSRGAVWPVPAVLLMALMLSAVLFSGPAAAQGPDYGKLFGMTGGHGAASEPSSAEPRQSLPVGDPGNGVPGPSAADSARLAQSAPDSAPAPMLGTARKAVGLFRERLAGTLNRTPGAFHDIGATLSAASPTGHGIYFLGVAVFAALLLVIGRAVAEFYVQFVARPIFVRVQAGEMHGYADKLPVLVYRVLLTAVGMTLTTLVAAAVGLFLYEEHEATELTVITIFATYVAVFLADTVWRMALAPFLRHCRLPEIGDAEARSLYRWLTVTSAFGIVTSAFCYWVEVLGLPREVHVLVTVLLSLATVTMILMLMRANHAAVTRMILAGQPRSQASWLSRAGAALWAPLISLYLVVTWGDMSFRLIMGFETGPGRLIVPFVTLIAGLVAYAAANYVIERVFAGRTRIDEFNAAAAAQRAAEAVSAPSPADTDAGEEDDEGGVGEQIALGGGRAAPGPRRGMRTMEDLARRVASLVALGASAYALAVSWAGSKTLAESSVIDSSVDLLPVCFVGYVTFQAVRIWLDRKIEDEGGDIELTPGDEGGAAGATRLATLLPLMRNFILGVILISIALVLAMQLGANVAPLFAGAGIIGLAIGFGSQALVRDILSGAFFLLDDAFRKGEYIDVGEVKGTVEKISLRSFQLRHHLGMLHTIPFGEIQHLTNFSRDWVMMKLPLRLTYETDVERVRKLIKKLGLELMEDPTVGDKFLQPLKSQGVIQMDDSAMIVRVKFMTRPGDQWVIRKRVFAEIRELFEREGIKFAHREVTVRIPDLPEDQPLSEDRKKAAGAASRVALDVVESEMLPATGTAGAADDR